MSKHSTTPRTLSRRLAALLTAMALLAAMALPVYAEALDDATQMQETVETDNNGETDDKSETKKDTDTGTGTESEGTNDDASSSTTGDSNTTADDAVNDTPQTLPADNTAPTAADENKNNTNDTTSKDSSDNSESQEDVQQQDDGEAEDTSLATQANVENTFTIYFAVPSSWGDGNYQVYVKAQKGGEGNGANLYAYHEMKKVETSKYQDRILYKVDLTFSKNDTSTDCPWDGYNTLQFCKIENSVETWLIAFSNTWTNKSVFANNLFDGENKNWVQNYQPFDPNNHQTFAGKTMLFQNQSDHELTNVKAVFYEKDQEVATIDLGTLGAIAVGKRVSFKIPKEDCTYIRFIVDGKETTLYSFYGKQNDDTDNSYFLYDSGTACCYVYKENDNGSSWRIPQGTITVYFDATFSSAYTEKGDTLSIPVKGSEDVYCCFKNEQTTPSAQKMTPCGNNLYSVEVPEGYSEIMFSGDDSRTSPANSGVSTDWVPIDWSLDEPCYMADTNDAVVYNNNAPRGGYWKEKNAIRDAEAGKGTTVVDIDNTTPFVRDSATKYVTTTLYDYYTDWELNGNNRDDYKVDNGASQRNWVTFRQFDQALSDYYSNSGVTVLYPMYTGQFQPEAKDENGNTWGCPFNDIADKLNLYGYNDNDKNKFMAVNNSTIDVNGVGLNNGETRYYDDAFQGLAGDELVDGEPVLYNTKLTVPYFNKDFLKGANSKKAVLGKVYENVDFPFTKEDVFGNGIKYWHYESNDKSLFLKQKEGTADQYFLQQPAETVVKDKIVSNNAQNVNSSSGPLNTYGFFPFNEGSTDTHANTYNYGFGAKLQFDFTLTDDGQVLGNDGKVPIQFFFSGDDDVWVYIDDKLALDVGGDHGKVSGLLEFGLNSDKKLVYTPYVSDVKASNADRMYTKDLNCKSVNYREADKQYKTRSFNYKGNQKEISAGKHTLKFFYMERGMWESNMAIAFNFPDHNELQVKKEVNVTGVNELFQNCFTDKRLFNFTIRNQATHYGTTATAGDTVTTINLLEPGKSTSEQKDFTTTATHATDTDGENRFTKVNSPPDYLKVTDGTPLLNWYTQFEDLTPSPGSNKDKRYGILALGDGQTIDITGMSYLSFDVYVDSKAGDAALSNMYLELRDSKGKQKGCLGQTFIGGKDLYGQVEMHNNQWITVKLSLDDVKAEKDFDEKHVKELRFGCNYPRSIYLRNIVFSSKAVPQTVTGFTTKQQDIADYGSAQKGELMPAVNAQYTSDAEKGTMVVDKNGGFVLKTGETISFKDQFRRGSYLSINEQVDKNLFDTQWTIYEDGKAVTSTKEGDGKKLTLDGDSISLKDKTGTAPDDGRIEKEDAEGNTQENNYYNGTKPSKKDENDNTIVFRSYANPDATDADGETQLKVVFVNTVKTGSLTIKKEQDGKGESLEGKTYTFKVRFTNVGGHALEDEAIVREYPVTVGVPFTIDKIPVGTRFTIEEVTPTDGSKLTHASVTGGGSGTMVLDNQTVRGSIVAGDAGDENQAVATFTNTKQELLDITGEKVWKDANGTPVTSNLPDIYVQLQRRHKITQGAQEAWQLVKYQNQDYRPVINNYGGMKFSFLGLPAKDYSIGDKPDFEYRVVEGYVDKEGFHTVEEGKTITIDEKVYGVTYDYTNPKPDAANTNNAKQTVTITNTQQDPKFTLDVTKKSAENDGENDQQKLLAGVEFTLERLTTDSNGETVVDSPFGKRTGVTNDQGELMLTDSSGKVTQGFTELKAGTYRLTETKAAENYNLLSAPILVTFDKDGTCTLNGSKIEVSTTEKRTEFTKNEDGSYTLALTVLNRKTPALPHTGADAPSLWLLIGLPLAVAGLLILVFRYNKKGGRTR